MTYHIKKTVIFSLVAVALSFACESQDFSRSMLSGNSNYYDVIARADSFFTVHPPDTTVDGGFMQYQRWKWFWQTRVDSVQQGKFGSFKYARNALLKYQQNLICTTLNNLANWNPLGPGIAADPAQELGIVVSVAVDPFNSDIVYVGTNASGLWKTTNASAFTPTWTNVTDVLKWPGLGIQDIVIDPINSNIIYIATGISTYHTGYGIGVLKSTDGGNTWNTTGLSFNPNQNIIVNKLLINPINTNMVYALIRDQVYKSINSGTTWQSVFQLPNSIGDNPFDPGSPARFIKDIDMKPTDPNVIYVSTDDAEPAVTVTNNGGAYVYKTTDGFNTPPIPIHPNISVVESNISKSTRISIAVTAAETSSVYAIFNNATVNQAYLLKSLDEGNSWTLISTLNNNSTFGPIGGGIAFWWMDFELNQLNPNVMYVGASQLTKSITGGLPSSWSFISDYSPCSTCKGHADIRATKIFQSSSNGSGDVLLMGNDGGVSISFDGGGSWKNLTQTLPITQFYGIGTTDQNTNLIIGGAQDNGTWIFNAPNWQRVFGCDGGESIIDYTNASHMYGICNNDVLESFNGGLSWNFTSAPPPFILGIPMKIDPINPNTIYVGKNKLYRRKNSSWSDMAIPSSVGGRIGSMAVALTNNNIMYASYQGPVWNTTPTGLLFKTNNAQATSPLWVDITSNITISDIGNNGNHDNPFAYTPLTNIIVKPDDQNTVWLTFGGFWAYKVIKSTDGGLTWTDLSNGLPNFPVNTIIYEKGSDDGLYIGTDVGVFYTNNKTYSTQGWVCFNDNLPVCIVSDLEINYGDNTIRTATYGRGLWESYLACPPNSDLNFTTSTSSNISNTFQEAENNITVTANTGNINLTNFTARAGNEIVITATGNNEVVIGPNSDLFIHACNHPGNSFKQAPPNNSPQQNSSSEISERPITQSDNFKFTYYPNPFTDHLHIDFLLEKDSPVLVSVYNLIGQLIEILAKGNYDAGEHTLLFNNPSVKPGLYFVRMDLGEKHFTKAVLKVVEK